MKIGINKDVIDHAVPVDGQNSLNDIVAEISKYYEVVLYTENEKVATKQSGVSGMLDTEDRIREFCQSLTTLIEDKNAANFDTENTGEPYSKARAIFYGLLPLTGVFGIQFFIVKSKFQYFYAAIDAGLISSIFLAFLPPMTKSCCGGIPPAGFYIIFLTVLYVLPTLYVISLIWSIWCFMQEKPKYGITDKKKFTLSAIVGLIAIPMVWLIMLHL